MIATDLAISLILAALAAPLLYWWAGWRHPAGPLGLVPTFGYLGAVHFAFVWAAAVWLPPLGPVIKGVAPLPFLLPAIFLGLLFASMAPSRGASQPPVGDAVAPARAFGPAFVALVVGLTVFAIVGYLA
jgi:hypothetical protein